MGTRKHLAFRPFPRRFLRLDFKDLIEQLRQVRNHGNVPSDQGCSRIARGSAHFFLGIPGECEHWNMLRLWRLTKLTNDRAQVEAVAREIDDHEKRLRFLCLRHQAGSFRMGHHSVPQILQPVYKLAARHQALIKNEREWCCRHCPRLLNRFEKCKKFWEKPALGKPGAADCAMTD